jgi:hypothetical protein
MKTGPVVAGPTMPHVASPTQLTALSELVFSTRLDGLGIPRATSMSKPWGRR